MGAKPLEFVQVAFAGHNRSEDLGDLSAVSEGLTEAFQLLAAAGVARARLVTGLAEGADRLAVQAWRAQGLGPVHAVFPHLAVEGQETGADLADAVTWLDGEASEAAGRNPHLAQTRWLIGAADLLVVVWTGERGRGAGGTADAVRLALEHGAPVLWVKSVRPGALRLIRPEHLDDDFGFLELVEELRFERAPLVTLASVESIQDAIAHVHVDRQDVVVEDTVAAHAWLKPLWRTYALFRKTLGGRAPPFAQRDPPADLRAQAGFQSLTRAQQGADERASRLGAVHRSQQIILLGLAIAAAIAASASALWPDFKLVGVGAELMLALGALLIWRDSERGGRHEHWSAARRLAEDLRLERVAWTLGVNTASHEGSAGAQARHLRRLAGLPEGRFDRARAQAWGAWVVDELIFGQVAYHRAQVVINGRIAHRVHQFENASFSLLLLVLASYVATSVALMFWSADPPNWLGGLVMVTGAIVPAIGAASLALEATLSLAEQARRSDVLAARLQSIAEQLGPSPGVEALQAAVKSAVRLAQAQEDRWLEGSGRRRLYRGG